MATKRKKAKKKTAQRKPPRMPAINALALSLRDDVLVELRALRAAVEKLGEDITVAHSEPADLTVVAAGSPTVADLEQAGLLPIVKEPTDAELLS